MSAQLLLSNGETLQGELFGFPVQSSGELVFTTAMTGYTETLTDPSYFGQIVIFSYPLIGNYGVPTLSFDEYQLPNLGFESEKIQVQGVIVSSNITDNSHWQSLESLDSWLKKNKIPGIWGVDTRKLVHFTRSTPNLLAMIKPQDPKEILHSEFFDPNEKNILQEVSPGERRIVGKGNRRVALVNCGAKANIVRKLISHGCEVEILPWGTDFKSVDCNGWLLSNGPGDPKKTGNLKNQVAELLMGERPILGICLGQQILALAAGADTKRMPFGHRGINHPVQLVGTKRGFLTSQNHGFVVDESTLSEDWTPWFVNANDGGLEGIRHKSKPFRSIQFHPESSPGPNDTSWIFRDFVEDLK